MSVTTWGGEGEVEEVSTRWDVKRMGGEAMSVTTWGGEGEVEESCRVRSSQVKPSQVTAIRVRSCQVKSRHLHVVVDVCDEEVEGEIDEEGAVHPELDPPAM
jgi:hypothetical protein